MPFHARSFDHLPRVCQRPSSTEWAMDELMTLAEAAAVFWPRGPLTERSLRTAASRGELAVRRIAGKILVTPKALAAMVDPEADFASRPSASL